jgi:hypothetical protein
VRNFNNAPLTPLAGFPMKEWQLICRHNADTGLFAKTSKIQIMPDFHGERGGTRTLDPMIKSHVLYHLSYALTCRAV